jgi:hypothetical protein
MMASEQDHRRLNSSFESKVAIDAELADFQENVRNEVFFVISGLPRIPPEVHGKEWQRRAIADVQKVIKTLLDRELPIIVVQNVTGRNPDSPARYHVRMEFAAHSQEIRSKFGSFFVGGADRRPSELSSVSISNRITPGTQVRIAILRVLGQRHVDSNAGAKFKVIGFESRPVLRLIPAPEATSQRVRSFTYIEAIKSLPTCFSKEEIDGIMKKIDPKFRGQLRSTFVVLSDDDFKSRSRDQAGSARNKRGRDASPSEDSNPKR